MYKRQVFISNAERRLPVQYAKRVVGRKMYGGQSTHIPIKVNMSGVMPIIFAQSIASLPATIGAVSYTHLDVYKRQDIDYGFAEAATTYGRIGVKVWIYKGEVLTQALRTTPRTLDTSKPYQERRERPRRDRRDGDRRGGFNRDRREGGFNRGPRPAGQGNFNNNRGPRPAGQANAPKEGGAQ